MHSHMHTCVNKLSHTYVHMSTDAPTQASIWGQKTGFESCCVTLNKRLNVCVSMSSFVKSGIITVPISHPYKVAVKNNSTSYSKHALWWLFFSR